MSPLRPSILTIRPRRPQPAQVRQVCCPSCARRFEVSQRAMTARCPDCTRPLRLDDLIVRQDQQGPIATMGQVELMPRTGMQGVLVCGSLVSHGRFDGQAVVHGHAELHEGSITEGQMHCRSLTVWVGAQLQGKASITPHPQPQIQAPSPSPVAGHRPLQLAPPRLHRHR